MKLKLKTLLCISFLFTQLITAQSLKLTNTNQYVNIGDLDISGNQLTIEAKIFISSTSAYAMNIVSKHTDSSDLNYLLRPKTFEISTSNGFYLMNNPYALELNKWYHVAGTYDGQFVRYYVNGCLVIKNPATGNLLQNNINTGIGNRTQNFQEFEQFFGSIDEVRIWNVCRSENDIKNNMNTLPNPTTQVGLKGYYKFNSNLLNEVASLYHVVAVGPVQYGNESSSINTFEYTGYRIVSTTCSQYTIELLTNVTNAQYSLNGTNYSTSNSLSINPGNQNIWIRSPEGCVIQTVLNLPPLPLIAPIFSQIAPICSGSTISLPLTSNNGITGTWSPALNNTTTTTYTFTPNIGQCGSTATMTISILPAVVAPTGSLTQFFCSSATIADLVVTGNSIKWYDAATGGNLMPSTTPLVNGNTYYASSTTNNCESTTRLAVTVNSINVPEITASANTVCSGTAVSLTAGTTTIPFGNTCTLPTNLQIGLVGYWPFCGNTNDTSGNNNDGTVNGATLTSDRFGNVDSAYSFDGVNDFIETNRTHLNSFTASVWIKLNVSNCFSAILDAYPSSWEFLSDCVSGTNLSTAIWNNSTTYQIYQSNYIIPQNKWINVVMTYGNNILKIYSEGNLVYTFTTIAPPAINGLLYFGRSRSGTEQFFNGKLDDVGIWNKILTPQEINQLYTPEISYLWSTGETSATINPTPTATTTYWVDVTTNGSTCRKSITITVKNTPAPTGSGSQLFCNDKSIEDLAVNGTAIKWYASATSTTTLTNNNTLINGTTYFATQTIDGCESSNRFQTSVSILKVPTPNGNGIQKFCLEENPVISNLIVTGNSIIWFDAFTNGMIIDNATLLQDNTTYFATTLDTATGCESIQRLAVKVDLFKCNITPFNLITINGNSLNDQLTFDDISYFPDNSVKIYNRYGKLVWETTGYDNTTNAFKGKANVSGVYMKDSFLPAGTYFYILLYNNTYTGKQTELTGYLQIDNAN